MNLKNELEKYRIKHGLISKKPCTSKECSEYEKILAQGGTLPKDIFKETSIRYDDSEEYMFYHISETQLTESEIMEYLAYKKLDMIETIKKCIVFFTVIVIIDLVANFIMLML